MERKTKQRILGVMVTIGLVVILLPLFQTGEPSAANGAFSKQEQEASEPVIPVNAKPDAKNDSPYPSRALAESQTPEPVPILDPAADQNAVRLQPDDVIQMNHPSIISEKNQNTPDAVATKDEPKVQEVADDEGEVAEPLKATAPVADNAFAIDARPESATEKMKMAERKSKAKAPVHLAKREAAKLPSPQLTDDTQLAQVQSAAWVIQLGTFKNKANAERLVTLLKASGYKAFTRKYAKFGNDGTRVFVGPEPKITVANNLAGQLKEDFKLHGIVTTYDPQA